MKKIMKVIQLTWVDSQASDRWTNLSEFAEPLTRLPAAGILIHEDSESYVLAVSFCDDTEDGCQTLRIPKRSVIGKTKVIGRVAVET